MNRRERRARALRAWGVPVIRLWLAPGPGPAIEAAPVQAAATVIHYHLHLAPGQTAADVVAALPQQRDAITIKEDQQ